MKDSEVYFRAAQAVDAEITRCSCDAVAFVHGGENYFAAFQPRCPPSPLAHKYGDIFSPRESGLPLMWGEEWADDDEDCKSCRVLALLFMHQIALDDEKQKRKG